MDSKEIYHEKQEKMLCCLHAINNLFQDSVFTKNQLDDICRSLDSTHANGHRNQFGLGNYDVNVLMKAVDDLGYQTIWVDRRKKLIDQDHDFDSAFGFILNARSFRRILKITLPFTGPHWIAFRKINFNGTLKYYDLDSKLDKPNPIANTTPEFISYIQERIDEYPDTQLLMINKNK